MSDFSAGIGLWAMSNPCLDVFISERHRWISLSGEEDVGAVDRLRRISLTTILGLGELSVLSMRSRQSVSSTRDVI